MPTTNIIFLLLELTIHLKFFDIIHILSRKNADLNVSNIFNSCLFERKKINVVVEFPERGVYKVVV